MRSADDLVPFPNNPKTHNEEQISTLASNIEKFGFDQPVLVDEDSTVLKGHGRRLAARKLGVKVPTIVHKGLSFEDKWAIVISDNAIPAMTGFDQGLLRIGLTSLAKANYDLKLTGFDQVRLATFIGGTNVPTSNPDEQPELEEKPITKKGESWQLGEHVLHCSDSEKFKPTEDVRLVLSDPPYELDGVGGGIQAKRTYPDKIMAAGIDKFSVDSLKTFAKTNVFFTSKKLVPNYIQLAIDKNLPWDLNVMHRANAMPNIAAHMMTDLDYIILMGAMNPARGLELPNYSKMISLGHWERPVPWAKPIQVLTKYIRLFSGVGDLVFDPYCGSGSTIIACATEGRCCIGVEISPVFVDLAVRRWEKFAGKKAILVGTKKTFDQIEKERSKIAA